MKNVYTVAQVNGYIKNMFTQDFLLQSILVKGEVSNCKYHSSGHIYFTLKDGKGRNCLCYVCRQPERTEISYAGRTAGCRRRDDRRV